MREPRIVPDFGDAYRDRRHDYRDNAGYAEDSYERYDRGYAGYEAEDPYERQERGYGDYSADDRGEGYDYSDRGGYADQDRDNRGDYRVPARYLGQDRRGPGADAGGAAGRSGEASVKAIFGSGGGTKQRKPLPIAGPAKGLWFVFGAAMGIGAMIFWSSPPTADSLNTLVALFESPNPPAVAEEPKPPVVTKAQERLNPPGETVSATAASDGELVAMVEDFVTSLRTQLPMAVGPGITMASVEGGPNAIALGFTIAQSVAAEDAPKLQSELETRFRNSVCATEPDPTNIHGLNARGVSFLINYTDLLGKTVAGLTVEPNYCASPA